MTRLLAATDLLPKTESAVDRAGLLAQELGSDLSMLHVVSPVSSERVLEQSLEVAIERMKSRVRPPMWRAGATPDVMVRAGNPARVIMDAVARQEPDLLILGPHERRGVFDALQGTIAEKAVSARKCPVLMVQQSASAAYRNVLLALDVSAASRSALRAAERLVLTDQARVTAFHACGLPDHGVLGPIGTEAAAALMQTDCSQDEASAAMRRLLEQESSESKRYELVVAAGNPVRAIMRAMKNRKPDLLVMGTRGDGRMRRAVLGSVANQLLKIAHCDVLIVPRDTTEASLAPDANRAARSSAPISARSF